MRNGLIIFGGTGDLTKRKLIPAIYNLHIEEELPEQFFVVAVGRRDKTTNQFRQEMKEAIHRYSRRKFSDSQWTFIEQRIYYYQLPFDKEEGYQAFDDYLKELEEKYQTAGHRLYYLAVAPHYFGLIADKLKKHQMAEQEGGWKRIIIEKPFGKDLASAKQLSQALTRCFGEENTYRIDHYLGKEMLQNIMVIRFANTLFEPLWNNKYIDHIQITSFEQIGVEERGGYYEKSGALKDMLQNHLLQLLALTTMEPPVSLETESIRDEKVKVFKGLKIYTPDEVADNVVRGQYAQGQVKEQKVVGYRQENRIDEMSKTETFIALKAEIENFRWMGVPFYIRTGKRMAKKTVEVVVQFKTLSKILYLKEVEPVVPNQLIIRIQPNEGVYLRFNAKKPGQTQEVIPVRMDFCQNCEIGYNSPEAYERLLLAAMKGEKELFTRWDEVEYSWRFIDAIAEAWQTQEPDFPNYSAGSFGPEAANQLLAREGRRWLNKTREDSYENI